MSGAVTSLNTEAVRRHVEKQPIRSPAVQYQPHGGWSRPIRDVVVVGFLIGRGHGHDLTHRPYRFVRQWETPSCHPWLLAELLVRNLAEKCMRPAGGGRREHCAGASRPRLWTASNESKGRYHHEGARIPERSRHDVSLSTPIAGRRLPTMRTTLGAVCTRDITEASQLANRRLKPASTCHVRDFDGYRELCPSTKYSVTAIPKWPVL
jgi:hypothetical protein